MTLVSPTKTTYNRYEKVVINVSGMRFETRPLTLDRFPDTLLGNQIKRKQYFDFTNNEYFFERHRQSFESILFYYQSDGRYLIRPLNVSTEVFFDEIVFFQLGDSVIEKYKKDEGYMIKKDASLELPSDKYKRHIWLLFEYPQSSIYARIIAIISVIIVVLSITLFCLETVPEIRAKRIANEAQSIRALYDNFDNSSFKNSHSNHTKYPRDLNFSQSILLDDIPSLNQSIASINLGALKDEFFILETICIIWFVNELALRLYAAPDKIIFLKQTGNLIDFFSIIPYFMQLFEMSDKLSVLRTIRLVRVFRIFKLARHFQGLKILAHTLQASAKELGLLVFFLIIGVILFSSTVYYLELDTPTSNFESIPDGFWYAIITMTTVGYGDQTPTTILGRFIGSFCAIAGVLTIALPVPIIVSHFQFFYQSQQNAKQHGGE